MGYNIINDEGYEFTCTNQIWVTMLNLAKENGWEPGGRFFSPRRYLAEPVSYIAYMN